MHSRTTPSPRRHRGTRRCCRGGAPASTGIFANDLAETRFRHGAAQDPPSGRLWPGSSPRRFRGTALYDWLLARDSATRVLAVSRKDRAPIMPVGRARGNVFWYVARWLHHQQLVRRQPAGLARRVEQRAADRRALTGKEWGLFRDPATYTRSRTRCRTRSGVRGARLHLPAPAPGRHRPRCCVKLRDYPWMDSLTLDVALEGVRAPAWAGGRGTDLLVGVAVDHRCDRARLSVPTRGSCTTSCCGSITGWAGSSIRSRCWCRATRTVFALTADHGVQPFPERTGGRAAACSLKALAQRAAQEYQARYRIPHRVSPGTRACITADVAALRARGRERGQPGRGAGDGGAGDAGGRPGIHAALARAARRRPMSRRGSGGGRSRRSRAGWWRRPARPGWIWADTPGLDQPRHRPSALDMHVPIIFMGPGLARAAVSRGR